jgi:hypothetical protein
MAKQQPATPTPTKRTFQRRKQLERDLEHISQEMYKRNRELAETNITLSLLRHIDTLVLEPHQSLQEVCQQITDAITAGTEYSGVALLTQLPHAHNDLSLSGWSVKNSKKPPHIANGLQYARITMQHNWFHSEQKQILLPVESLSDEQIAKFIGGSVEVVQTLRTLMPLKSVYAVKLYARSKLVGIIMVGFLNPVEQLTDWDSRLLDRLSEGKTS